VVKYTLGMKVQRFCYWHLHQFMLLIIVLLIKLVVEVNKFW